MENKSFVKKRIMFIQKEDYNFLSYNLLLLLDCLNCTQESVPFKDFRKIAYLVDFISSSADIEIYSQDELANIYSKAQLKKKLLSHILIVLKNKDYLDISINHTHRAFDIWIKKENIPSDFWDNDGFGIEKQNIKQIQSYIRGLRISAIKTLVDKIFTQNNVLTWEI